MVNDVDEFKPIAKFKDTKKKKIEKSLPPVKVRSRRVDLDPIDLASESRTWEGIMVLTLSISLLRLTHNRQNIYSGMAQLTDSAVSERTTSGHCIWDISGPHTQEPPSQHYRLSRGVLLFCGII